MLPGHALNKVIIVETIEIHATQRQLRCCSKQNTTFLFLFPRNSGAYYLNLCKYTRINFVEAKGYMGLQPRKRKQHDFEAIQTVISDRMKEDLRRPSLN